jgi:MoaA/NifB/PqqE/SkfB family radical SAM enzyme
MNKLTLLNQARRHYRQFGLTSLAKQNFSTLKWFIEPKLSLMEWYTNKNFVYPYMRFVTPKLDACNIELTNACNLKCKMCTARDRRKIGFMSKPLFYKCIDEFAELNCRDIYLHGGGESLLHPNFKEFLTYACKVRGKGIKEVGWVDNGTLFDKDTADLVISLGVDHVSFSIDGLGEINDKIRIGSNYEKIRENITYLLSHRRNGKPTVVINTVDCDKTQQEINNFLKVWTKLADCVCLVPTFNAENALQNPRAYFDGYATKQEPYCFFPFSNMTVCWDGKVTGCCADPVAATNLGNANTESLGNIWKGKEFKHFRKQLLTNNFDSGSLCTKCDFWREVFTPSCQKLDGMKVYYEGYRKKFVKDN